MKYRNILILLVVGMIFSGCSWLTSNDKLNDDLDDQSSEVDGNNNFQSFLNSSDLNKDLNMIEKEWLGYLVVNNPNSKVYHVITKAISCEGCYELYYKQDSGLIKLKLENYSKVEENIITDDIGSYLISEKSCAAFSGQWNSDTFVCDFQPQTYKQLNEECGSSIGDCDKQMYCHYEFLSNDKGICKALE